MRKIVTKIILIILLLLGGSALAGIIQEEFGYGFLHGLVMFGVSIGFLKIIGIFDLKKKKRKTGDYGIKQEKIDNYGKSEG